MTEWATSAILVDSDGEQEGYFAAAGARYEDNAIPMKAFLAEHRVRMTYEEIPAVNAWTPTVRSFRCTFVKDVPGERPRTLTETWSHGGLGDDPEAHGVMHSLRSDAESVDPEYCRSYEQDFMPNYCEADDRECKRIYRACVKGRERLIRFFGEEEYAILRDRVEQD